MAAVDYARLRERLPRDRLLFVAHREEILEQSRATFAHALRDASFGEFWVGGKRPVSLRTRLRVDPEPQPIRARIGRSRALRRRDRRRVPSRGRAVVPDASGTPGAARAPRHDRHARARRRPRRPALLRRTDRRRAPGVGRDRPAVSRAVLVLRRARRNRPDRRAVEARHRLRPERPDQRLDRRPRVGETGRRAAAPQDERPARDQGPRLLRHDRARSLHGGAVPCGRDPGRRGLGRQPDGRANGGAARSRRRTSQRRLHRRPVQRRRRRSERRHAAAACAQPRARRCSCSNSAAACDAPAGRRSAPCSTSSATIAASSASIDDFARCSAAAGATSSARSSDDFPFLPAGCHMELDPVARDIVLRSIREAIPSDWKAKREELRSLGDVSLATYLEETGLELEDVYASNHSWSELRRAVGLPTDDAGPRGRRAPPRASDGSCTSTIASGSTRTGRLSNETARPIRARFSDRERRFARMLIGSLTTLKTSASLADGLAELWNHPQVRSELLELLDILPERVDHLHAPLGIAERPARRARPVHADRDPGRVRRRQRRQADHVAVRRLVGREQPERPVRVHARQVRRLVLSDHAIPRLRDQPGADPLGEPVGDRRSTATPAAATSARPSRERTSCSSLDSAPPIERSGASARRPTSRTKANARSRSRGASITVCPATSSPSSPRSRNVSVGMTLGVLDRRAPQLSGKNSRSAPRIMST